jgi:hypothetical protein
LVIPNGARMRDGNHDSRGFNSCLFTSWYRPPPPP